jgi:hypothetical protein
MFVGLISGCADMTPDQQARIRQAAQDFSRANEQNMNNIYLPLLQRQQQQQQRQPINCTTYFNDGVASTRCF